RLHQFGTIMTAASGAMLRRWREPRRHHQPINIGTEMMRLTLEIIGTTMFSTYLSDEASHLGALMTTAIEYLTERMASWMAVFDFPEKLPTPTNRRFRAALREGDRVVRSVIEQRRKHGTDHRDLLSMLMEALDEETGEGMTDQQLRDELITIFAAGH